MSIHMCPNVQCAMSMHGALPVAYNGLCTCRGWHEPHPFHVGSHTTAGHLVSTYVGRHREEEDVD